MVGLRIIGAFSFLIIMNSIPCKGNGTRSELDVNPLISMVCDSVSDTYGFSDSLGIINYDFWLEKRDSSYLALADDLFSQNFECLEKVDQFDYSIGLARTFTKNNEDPELVKKWYLRAIDSFDAQSPENFSDISEYEILEKKYGLVLEFTGVYSRKYGKCEEAVDILRSYKMRYNFKYIKYNRGLDQTDEIWLKLVREDQRLSWECEEK